MARHNRLNLSFEVVAELSATMSDADAAKELNISMVAFYNARKKFNLLSFFEQTGLRKNKAGETYSFFNYNERYFEKIDTEGKAYFLGLLATDGNINPRLTAARIALKEEDCLILERFRNELGSNAPKLQTKISTIRGKKSLPQKSLVLSRVALVKDLMKLGILPNKSKTLEITTTLQENLVPHFLRGAWDGDGSVTDRRFKITTASIKFAVQLQTWIKLISSVELPIKSEFTKNGSNLFHLPGYKKDAKAIQAIYQNSDFAIERKFKNYIQFWEPRR
jgi:hypothetical protein